MTDKQRILSEIEGKYNEWKLGSSAEAKYRREAYKELIEFIKSMQEEPVSEELEEAVNAYIGFASEVDECSSVYGKRQAFKAGAKWQS